MMSGAQSAPWTVSAARMRACVGATATLSWDEMTKRFREASLVE